MVKHMIIWKLKPRSEEAFVERKKLIKENLENLVGKIPGLISMHIQIDNLDSSIGDMLMDSTMESVEALKVYTAHPDHVYVAETFIRPYVETRLCIDYEK